MKSNMLVAIAAIMVLLSGCDEGKQSRSFVKLATLHAIEVESVSMIGEEKGNNKMLLRIPCSAWLGVDLDEVEYDDSQSGRLIVKLPPISVSSPKVHHDKETVLDERRSLWSSANVNQELREKAERHAQAEVADIAMSPDAVKLAKNQTRKLVECFYRMSEPDREVRVEWKKD